ncbi:MAG: hypothetical protein IPM96_14005 [Ignavibacteria bacterium]|nr:hypothetical protein [Ignavibacteria bacterium]
MFSVLTINVFNVFSQVNFEWANRYNFLNASYGNLGTFIILDEKNNILVTGYSSGTINRKDMVLINYSQDGVYNWISRYADTITPYPNNSNGGGSLIFDKQGNIFNGGSKLWKYSQKGNLIWTVDPGIYRGYGRIYFDKDYNILTSSELANSSFHIRKYSYEGDTMWVRIFKPAGTIDARWKDAVLDQNGDIITTGYINKTGIGDRYDCMTVKYSNSGDELWNNRFSEGMDNFSYSIACDNSNNIYIAGEKDLNILTIKYSSDGDTLFFQKTRLEVEVNMQY